MIDMAPSGPIALCPTVSIRSVVDETAHALLMAAAPSLPISVLSSFSTLNPSISVSAMASARAPVSLIGLPLKSSECSAVLGRKKGKRERQKEKKKEKKK